VSGVWVPRGPVNCAGSPSRPDCCAEVDNRESAESAIAPLSAVLSDAALQDSLPRCLANCRQENENGEDRTAIADLVHACSILQGEHGRT
jgi:hypothetical protein